MSHPNVVFAKTAPFVTSVSLQGMILPFTQIDSKIENKTDG
jgi:hypothetical protein